MPSLANATFIGGAGIDDVRSAFAQQTIDHVILGAGIDIEKRLEIIREVFLLSATTTVHMKDQASGPRGFLPFVRALVVALSDDEA